MKRNQPEAEIGSDIIVHDPEEGPKEGLEFDIDAEESEEMGSPERSAKRINAWVREIVGVQDMTWATREGAASGVSEHTALGGARDVWKNEWCDLEVKSTVSGRYWYQTIPGGILNLIPEGPASVNEVTLTFMDPAQGGKERHIDLEPYADKGLTSPEQVQLLHVLKSVPGEGDPLGLDLDRVIVRTVHAPQFPAFDSSTGSGLEMVAVTHKQGPVVRNLYSLVDHQRIEAEDGSAKIIDVPVDMWNRDTGENQSSTFSMTFARNALRQKLAQQYRWVAALKIADIACDGDNSNVDQWMYNGRRLIYGAQAADQQEAEALIRIESAGTRREQFSQSARDF
jgi:hypothetical protein|tara:strand:+ start:3213 stop:4232 length:1020 start_codon:yes stop_codon:yes gene_type:complete